MFIYIFTCNSINSMHHGEDYFFFSKHDNINKISSIAKNYQYKHNKSINNHKNFLIKFDYKNILKIETSNLGFYFRRNNHGANEYLPITK